MGNGLKPENWVVATGVVFAIGVLVAAALPDGFWSEHKTSPIAAPADAIGNTMTQAMNQIGGQNRKPVDAGAGQKGAPGGLVPFTSGKTQRFQGNVVRVMSLGSDTGWGQVHTWVDSGTGKATEISVAPDWYLIHLGCVLKKQVRIRGTAFTFNRTPRPSPEFYAKTITVNGRTCRLRNDEGFALWSNRLR